MNKKEHSFKRNYNPFN